MRKDLGSLPAVFPMPVLMIATYGEDGTVDVMNAAWGGICGMDKVVMYLSPEHKTVENLKFRKAFTVALADEAHIKEADFFGIATGNKMPDKFERSGLHAVKSSRVDAPVIEEFPLTMECEMIEDADMYGERRIVGRIVNVIADEKVLDDKGKVDAAKLNPVMFDQFRMGYYAVGEKIAQAWSAGKDLMKG